MKTLKIILVIFSVAVLQSCSIQNPKKEDCITKEIKVVKITEGGVKDLVFHEANGDFYYINRGLENGFTIEGTEEAVLNKTVTLHLYKFWFGTESEHISQLEVHGDVLYSEFPEKSTAINH
ncbi:hypothetical protein [Rasiella sp. SM2506]|uniref:hypothetical protein n=1 Tax=Rasiella sp. SM2506 TaxID=3423914 RepID=UPI003D799EE6